MEFIKIPIQQLKNQAKTCNEKDRFSHDAFTRKVPKGMIPCDYDKKEKLIEFELDNGERLWFHLKDFFGKLISEVEEILMLYPDGDTETLSIEGIEIEKVKRTFYMKLIFEKDLPF